MYGSDWLNWALNTTMNMTIVFPRCVVDSQAIHVYRSGPMKHGPRITVVVVS